MGFLANLVKVFPSLKTRPLYLTGESYAGTYIVSLRSCYPPPKLNRVIQPYITKTYFGMENPPVNLKKIAIGDGSIGSQIEIISMPAVRLFANRTGRISLTIFVAACHRNVPTAYRIRCRCIQLL